MRVKLASLLRGVVEGAHSCWVLDGVLGDLTPSLKDLQMILDPRGEVFKTPDTTTPPSVKALSTASSLDITLTSLSEFVQTFAAISASFIHVHVMNASHDASYVQFVEMVWDDVSRTLHSKDPEIEGDLSRVSSPVHETRFDGGDVTFFKEIVGLMEGVPFDPSLGLSVDLIRARVLGSLVLYYADRVSLEDQAQTIKSLLQEQTKNLDFVLVCIEGLAILSIHETKLIPDIVDFLLDFLLLPSHLFRGFGEESAGIVQECAANALANLLDAPNCPHDLASAKKSTLFKCINTMHSSFLYAVKGRSSDEVLQDVGGVGEGVEVHSRRFSNSVSSISHLTRVLKPKDTVDMAIPALFRRIEESTPLQAGLWMAIGNIGMNNDAEIFKSIITTTLSNIGTSPHVSKVAILLARMPGRPLGLLQLYLEKVLFLFHEKVVFIHKNSDSSILPHLLHLTNLVRVLLENAHLCEYVRANYDFSQQLRNMWFCLVLFVQTSSGSWPPEWKATLKSLSKRCPAIVIDPQSRSLDVNLGSDSILVTTFSESVTKKIKPLLCNYAPSKANEIKSLSWPVSVFLLTVCQVESLRLKTLSIETLVGYLVDDRLQTPELYPVAERVIDGILKTALKGSHYRSLSASVIEDHLKSLLLFAAHRITSIRAFAAKWIMNILNAVPFMLFNRTIITNMLDLLRFLDNSKIGHYEEFLDSFSSKLNFLTPLEAHESAYTFYILCNDWVSSALKMSSAETIPILQSYISEISSVVPWIGSRQMEQAQNASPQGDLSSSFLMVLFQRFYADAATSAGMIRHSNKRVRLLGEVRGYIECALNSNGDAGHAFRNLSCQFSKELRAIYRDPSSPHFLALLYQMMSKCAALILLNEQVETELIMLLCNAPKIHFVTAVVEVTLEILSWIMSVKPELVNRILAYLTQTWEAIATKGIGIYLPDSRSINPFEGPMTYGAPRDIPGKDWTCDAHAVWINFLLERFKFDRLQGSECLYLYSSFIRLACQDTFPMSSAFKAREARLDLCILSIKVAKELSLRGLKTALFLWTDVFGMCCSLFAKQHSYGEMDKAHFSKTILAYNTIKNLKFEKLHSSLTTTLLKSAFVTYRESDRLEFSDVQQLLILLWENEIYRFASWIKPLASDESTMGFTLPPPVNERLVKWNIIIKTAWRINPEMAISLRSRFVNSSDTIDVELLECAKTSYIRAVSCSEAVSLFLKHASKTKSENQLRHLLYWNPVAPVTAVQILSQNQSPHPWVIQFAIRSLEDFPITLVFFYIPQLVQALRSDSMGYIEKYILEAAKSSQYFAHQIIWNMDANKYKDDDCEVPDNLKPVFDRIIEKIVQNLTGEDKAFYEREFSFFKEITDISGKLKPLVSASASKQEKKKKIDEELGKIKVDVGVYIPTNPDREVVDIDYSSGRPLQSHAKAPYMATFMVRNTGDEFSDPERMASIFKVGDDCRQDMLALQLIAVFQSIFQSAGLDLYTFPYRVVATAPGCGVIEAIPQSISRDMMGREKVNSLFDWFLAEFGSENSITFKTARNEFIKSLAAYSILMFLLQLKDRHNGNIMFDRQGHLLHIDFGFMLSIAPGGGILEVAPFKLTSEMIQVLGGDANSAGYILFSELCVKGYLACRLYSEEIVSIVQQMLDSGLPCFKGELTLRKLRERFQLDKSERGAADFMMGCIRQSHENTRSGLYDLFQYAQNGIPYKG